MALAGLARAQTEREWVSTDGSPPGTPAESIYDASASNASDSFFDVFVHGFWTESYVGPDNRTYRTLEVPTRGGMTPKIHPPGAPALPGLRFHLAVPTAARTVDLGQSFFDVFTIPRFGLVSPEWTPGLDHEEGSPPRFLRDEQIYGMRTPWPPTDGVERAPVSSRLGSISGATMDVFPFHWNPESGELLVPRRVRYHFQHAGTPQTSRELTKERVKLGSLLFHNWPGVSRHYLANAILYTADYLFVYEEKYADELKPLVNQKKARGFLVTEKTIPSVGNTCISISTIINNWYVSSPSSRDKYCLLVGDVDVIPFCTSPAIGTDYPSGVGSDDPYASTNGLDLDEEVFLGRLSVDHEADCANQVAKILAYEDSPPPFGNFAEALLVAHKENAPGKYVGAHESVRTALYAVPPAFTTLYGHIGGVSDADVSSEINDGLGLVAYRGHGSSSAWTTWNTSSENYNTADVAGLSNGPMTPVVWSFACNNAELGVSDCVGESWLEQTGNGAVTHYGSSVASYTSQNHELDRQMFKAVYDLGLTTHSHAIQYAEDQMGLLVGTSNAWMYNLLGDPDLQIRRGPPLDWNIRAPAQIPTCTQPPCNLTVGVLDPAGNPIPDALVAVWKPGVGPTTIQSSDEVFDNRYTGGDGRAVVPASPITPGWILYTVQDDEGNALLDSIQVTSSTGVASDPTRLEGLRAQPTITSTATFLAFGRVISAPAVVEIHDLSGRLVRRLEAPAGASGVRWDGRAESGARVTSGLYWARWQQGAQRQVARVVVAR